MTTPFGISMTFIILIYVCMAVLYAILIVKFFQMARDLRALKQKGLPCMKDVEDKAFFEFRFLWFNGYKDEALRFLRARIWDNNHLLDMMGRTNNRERFDSIYANLKREFERYANILGDQFPTYDEMFETACRLHPAKETQQP